MKEMNLLGIKYIDYTLQEALHLSERYISNGALNSVCFVNMKLLTHAIENPYLKECIESADILIYNDKEILHFLDFATRNRVREVEKEEYLNEFLRRATRNDRHFFLISEDENAYINMKENLQSRCHESMSIVGSFLMSTQHASSSSIVNEINDAAPDIVISQLPYRMQGELIHENKKLINAGIWILLPEKDTDGKKSHIKRLIQRSRLQLLQKRLRNDTGKKDNTN